MRNRKAPTTSELNVDQINSNAFFKEFTFSFDNFIATEKGEIELADNIVHIGKVSIIYEVKERNQNESTTPFKNWFTNKVLNKAKVQIKNTVKSLRNGDAVKLKNNRKHEVELTDINLSTLRKVIVYAPGESIDESERFRKFYKSSEVGLIHLFHLEDYLWICRYLITPSEIEALLKYREGYYNYSTDIDKLSEQYMLGHYFSDADYNVEIPNYTDFLAAAAKDIESFDLSNYFLNFAEKVELQEQPQDYYHILREIAQLHRDDLRQFKKRFSLIFEFSKKDAPLEPLRIVSTSGCGFLFLALTKEHSHHWKNMLYNLTIAHQYDLKLDRCLGVVVFESSPKRTEVFWNYGEEKWKHDEALEKLVKDKQLSKVTIKEIQGYGYKP